MSIHFPNIEAGRVRALCGDVRSKPDWTTKFDAVTCPRCLRLIRAEAEHENAAAPPLSQIAPSARIARTSAGA
jgi:hypothetical protein